MKLGSKAETLKRIKPYLSKSYVPEFIIFDQVEIINNLNIVIEKILSIFSNKKIIIRSSCENEDKENDSKAGLYLSLPLQENFSYKDLAKSLSTVSNSMDISSGNQIIVQQFVPCIELSGVVMTRDHSTGAPYYCINYVESQIDSSGVTSGKKGIKTIYVYLNSPEKSVTSPRIIGILNMVKEIESFFQGCPLDIEFASDNKGKLYTLQIRLITCSSRWHPNVQKSVKDLLPILKRYIDRISIKGSGIVGKKTIFGMMPDWNPAEIIGVSPKPLARSLYQFLITSSIWNEARASMGYKSLLNKDLMYTIGNNPFIDIRKSFNSFLPSNLPEQIGEKLINFWIEKLQKSRHLHDKIEFEVVTTCTDFSFINNNSDVLKKCLGEKDFNTYYERLHTLTLTLIKSSCSTKFEKEKDSINKITTYKEKIDNLEKSNLPDQILINFLDTLYLCRSKGTYTFSILARHGFVAESLLRSIEESKCITSSRVNSFRQSIQGVTTELIKDFNDVLIKNNSYENFILKYGHLRPSTYDICSPTYAEREKLFTSMSKSNIELINSKTFEFLSDEIDSINKFLGNYCNNSISSNQLIFYISESIKLREKSKFEFTKLLSYALTLLTRWGELQGFSKEDLSYIDVSDIIYLSNNSTSKDLFNNLSQKIKSSKDYYKDCLNIKLPHVLTDSKHIYVGTMSDSTPSFIGSSIVSGEIKALDEYSDCSDELHGKIVLILNADPGYDWVFTRQIAGLITCFGGPNSHMSVRCAELNIPAAIGCGENTYNKLLQTKTTDLNCLSRTISY
tara:strand:- start:1458 stop:3830 length:2373 start_codon:yes stop_codon:yes gene_type:complete